MGIPGEAGQRELHVHWNPQQQAKGKEDSIISTVASMTEEENKEGCSETGKSIQNGLCLAHFGT